MNSPKTHVWIWIAVMGNAVCREMGPFKLSWNGVSPGGLNDCPVTRWLLEAPFWQHSEVCSHQAFLSLHVRMTGTAKSNRNCLACFEEAFGKLLWSCYLSLPPNLGDMGRGNCSVLPQPDSRHFSNLSFHTRSESSRGILLGIQVSSTRWLSLIENTSGFHFLLNKSFVFCCCCFLKALD